MTASSQCFSLVRGRVMRATKLDTCGNPVYGPLSTVVSDGFITVGLAAQTDDESDDRGAAFVTTLRNVGIVWPWDIAVDVRYAFRRTRCKHRALGGGCGCIRYRCCGRRRSSNGGSRWFRRRGSVSGR